MGIDTEAVRAVAAAHRDVPGGLLPALHAVQDRWGHVPPESVPAIAGVFNLSRAEVHGVITYYHHFRSAPPAPHLLQLCGAEACQAMGAQALREHVARRLGCPADAGSHAVLSADGQVTLEPVYCLGLCASSPALMLDGEPHARMSPAAVDALLDELATPVRGAEGGSR